MVNGKKFGINRRMEDFDLEEVLKKVGNIDLIYKNFLIEQKNKKIEGDFV